MEEKTAADVEEKKAELARESRLVQGGTVVQNSSAMHDLSPSQSFTSHLSCSVQTLSSTLGGEHPHISQVCHKLLVH